MAKISELADGGAVLSDDEILVLRAGGNVRATIGSGLTTSPGGEVDVNGKKFTSFESTGIDDNATSTAITIDAAENVGIGTAAPISLGAGYKNLDIRDTVGGGVTLGDSSGEHGYLYSDNTSMNLQARGAREISLDTNGQSRVTINALGNVGIGTASPSELLEISGVEGALRLKQEGGAYANLRSSDFGTLYIDADAGNTSANSSIRLSVDAVERMRIDSSGNVGIGTSPSSPLHVKGSEVRIDNLGSPSNGYVRFMNDSGSMSVGMTGANENSLLTYDRANNQNASKFTGGASGSWDFMTNGVERLHIDASGNVGVGTTSSGGGNSYLASANTMLKVKGNSANKTGSLQLQSFGTANNSVFEVAAFDGSQGCALGTMTNGPLSFQTNNVTRATIDASGNVGIGTNVPTYTLHTIGDSLLVHDPDGSNTALVAVGSGGTSNVLIDGDTIQMRGETGAVQVTKDASGNLLVGASSQSNVENGTEMGISLSNASVYRSSKTATTVNTHMLFINPNGVVGSISTNGSATTYSTSSDERLKDNIVDAPAGNIDSIKVRSFDWKADGEHQDYGFIAQELEAVAPYAVTKGETDEDMWAVDYSKLVPMLVKEIQDLKAKVEALEAAN